ncbi:YtxH domain-containing protein [Candidatus Daviesbacteria bacterium]|nr:YtxH domain-containing protein [Candidatus Daviesbacteria bacterium]
MNDHHHESNGFLTGLLIGSVIGVGLSMLFTTENGKKIRQRLSDAAPDLALELDKLVQELDVKSEEPEAKIQQVKETAADKVESSPRVKEIEDRVDQLRVSTKTFARSLAPGIGRRFFHRSAATNGHIKK